MILADKTECDHPHSTLVQHDDVLTYDEKMKPEKIWFVCWQCDHCGAITPQPVPVEEVEQGNSLPWLDMDMYGARVKERPQSQSALASVRFMMRAIR